ncbi:DUF5107 domain-containing protein [Streptomyces sp. NP160]|uniref:DUF5107 domain-containing protein n=1 Tax=Streptomyces sp. NP160 TaxID=2586637 RepID=UPI001118C76F|nr:DUF5107 domain-containing protein [Streptomyces sp. NP160]TNM63165.1 DUF5107 domain-containing protein [Streptomyces sp. NP160]
MSTTTGDPSQLVLPPVPDHLRDRAVAVWREPLEIDTYEPLDPDRYPMFLESRVYQGSSGRVYPLPFHDRISSEKRSRPWDAIHIENEWIRLVVLPELGGRIHIGYDKASGYDFFYRNNVIKPALVGLAGPWISGGVEFNWPQHHRPGTFMPVDVEVEEREDGSVTVWCSDHEPFHRMKGMHGVTVHPDRAVVQVDVRLHNRTEDTRTFLWWANVAARVHDDFQSFFPPDVSVVADHAKRATTGFPRATTPYYGIDYPSRVSQDAPDADRLDWYRNIPVPTSYMVVGSRGDFFGGYDHAAQAGFVHWADHHVSPGKKQWTWGNAPFGWAWDEQLTDGDGPYVELMAGVYTDNQPDFSFLAPGETKTFTQYWYPVQKVGVVHQATPEAAVSLVVEGADQGGTPVARFGVAVTSTRPGLRLRLERSSGEELWEEDADLAPDRPFEGSVSLPAGADADQLVLRVLEGDRELLRLDPSSAAGAQEPVEPATEPPSPEDVDTVEELYLTGLHLAQYRHATRSPEPYWREALRRDPGDSRSATALATRAYERGELEQAEELLRTALTRLVARNPNPYDGEPLYRLGLVLVRQGRETEAYDAFAKSAWNAAWAAPAAVAMARSLARRQKYEPAVVLLDQALAKEGGHLAARDLQVALLRRLGQDQRAQQLLASTLELDPLDWWARHLDGQPLHCDARTCLDLVVECTGSGLLDDALQLVDAAVERSHHERWRGVEPLAHYYRADVLTRLGRHDDAAAARADARAADPTYCFPHTLDDAAVLRLALEAEPADPRAAALLGHWSYDRRRYDDAIALWRRAVEGDPGDAVCWRNLGVAAHNVQHDADLAVGCFERAVAAAPDDARLRYEADQLAKRTDHPPAQRLKALEDRLDLVAERDDLSLEHADLLLAVGRTTEARESLLARHFQPWEGGEGQVLGTWERTHLHLARTALAEGRPQEAQQMLEAALEPPRHLGEGPHLLANRSELHLALGDALAAQGQPEQAAAAWRTAAEARGDFQAMAPQPYSDKTWWSAQAWRRLGHPERAEELLAGLEAYADELQRTPAVVDYFATSLPTLLLFGDDLGRRRQQSVDLLRAQAAAARGHRDQAARRALRILDADPNHQGAQDLLALTATPSSVEED